MTMNISIEYTDSGGIETYHESVDKLTTLLGVRLHEIMVEESRVRADFLGGATGAVDTGDLSNSIAILEDEWEHVVVGTNLDYAYKLARGLPDPTTDIDDIVDWRRRKKVPRRSKQVWEKVTTEGPIANPFDERAVFRFWAEWENYIDEVMF